MPFSLKAGMFGGFSAALPSITVWISASSALVLSIFFSAVAPWHILHFELYNAAASSSLARLTGTEIRNAAATSGIPNKTAAIFFITAVTFLNEALLQAPSLKGMNVVEQRLCRTGTAKNCDSCREHSVVFLSSWEKLPVVVLTGAQPSRLQHLSEDNCKRGRLRSSH